jgi:hypothetical protein
MSNSVSSEDNLDWAGDAGAQSGGDPFVDSGFTSPNLAGITSLLTPFKGIFDRLKSGSTTANDVNAALGVLGLIMPSLNRPQTKGWKGSIDLTKQYNRAPIAQPAFTPYAQSASPVMGRQFFNTTYGAAPVAPPPTTPDPTIPAPGVPPSDPNNETTTGGGMAQGGIATAMKAPELRSGDFVFPADIISGFGNGSTAAGMEFVKKAFDAVPVYGSGDGMSDSLRTSIDGVQPAKVADGEAIVRRAKVAEIGGGDLDRGAEELYKVMDRLRHARTGNKEQGKQINPEKFTPGGIAGYAGGGAVAFQTGGAASTPTAPLGASNEQNISEWAGPYVGDMLSKTAALTNTPYQAYQGPMVAGTAPLQSKVFGGLESLNFPGQLGQSFTSQGAYTLPTAGEPGTPPAGPTGIASQYMNPYLSAVLTPQLEEMRRQSEISRKNLGAKFSGIGGGASAFGGGRQAIESAELERNLMQEQNKAIGTGYANAYDRAMGQFNTEQGQAKTLADMMAGAGQQQRGIEQEGITALQKQYETELLDPYTKLRFQKEMLQGLPVATASTTANTSQMGETSKNFADLTEALKKLGLG